jgi:hypothetical protein
LADVSPSTVSHPSWPQVHEPTVMFGIIALMVFVIVELPLLKRMLKFMLLGLQL